MNKHIVIFGPTAVGKTGLSLKLAKHFNCEIISADSTQIYKELNIGTAKISKKDMQGIAHHMIDIIEPGTYFSSMDFVESSKKILENLDKQNKKAIIVGGTGLYIDALTLDRPSIPKDMNLRDSLNSIDKITLYSILESIDKDYCYKISSNDKKRVIRAIEVYIITGRRFSSFHSKSLKDNEDKYLKVALIRDRNDLYKDIDLRVDAMFENNLLTEAKSIYNRYFKSNPKFNYGIGYNELFEYFQDNISFEEAKNKIKQNTRNYAKRQITWLNNRDFDVIDKDKEDPFEKITHLLQI